MNPKILIKSEEERLVFGEVYSPMDVDSQGEAMTAEEIKKAAYNFLSKGIPSNIDENHNGISTGCTVVESFLARKEDPDGFIEGSWVIGVYVAPDDQWEKVKSGELNCFSFAGAGQTFALKALVELPVSGEGETEDSTDGVLPPHSHKLSMKFDADGKVKPGVTEEELGHSHNFSRVSATEAVFEHSHRIVITPDKEK